jgi:hypothetical protein
MLEPPGISTTVDKALHRPTTTVAANATAVTTAATTDTPAHQRLGVKWPKAGALQSGGAPATRPTAIYSGTGRCCCVPADHGGGHLTPAGCRRDPKPDPMLEPSASAYQQLPPADRLRVAVTVRSLHRPVGPCQHLTARRPARSAASQPCRRCVPVDCGNVFIPVGCTRGPQTRPHAGTLSAFPDCS